MFSIHSSHDFATRCPTKSFSLNFDVALFPDGRLTVRDHGPGVPLDALPHVFERFYRSDEARALPGSGLGLAIVAQVADSHGGRVSLSNADDGGAVAELWLPPLADVPVAQEIPVPVGL